MYRFSGLIYSFIIVLGAFCAIRSIPVLHKYLGSDFKRIETVIEVLNAPDQKASMVLLGNSVLMSSIDAKIVMRNLKSNKEIYNLSSSGQSFLEGSLLLQDVKRPFEEVIHFVSITEMFELGGISKQVMRNYILSGFKLSKKTEERLRGVDLGYFNNSITKIEIEGRGTVKDAINRKFRSILRSDLNLRKLDTELYYPNTYESRLSPEKYKRTIGMYKIDSLPKDKISLKVVELIKRNYIYLKEKGIDYKLVISPINPDIYQISESELQELLKPIELENIPYINFANVLKSNQFVDHYHPDKSGAVILSNKLSKILLSK